MVSYQANAVGQVGNLGSTAGWGGQWGIGGIDAYAGQTLTVIIVRPVLHFRRRPAEVRAFQTTVQIPG